MTQPIEYEPWSSKTGVHVVPALTVFHTPPLPTPTYQTLLSVGWMTMSAMRPDMKAGPTLRISSPLNVASLKPGSGFSSSCAQAETGINKQSKNVSRFMMSPFSCVFFSASGPAVHFP